MQRPFSRLAIVNRGEPAMRLIHAVRELNEQRAEPIRVIALYTEPERHAMFVRHADEAYASARPRRRRAHGYLDHAGARARAARGARRRGVGRLGLRRRAPRVRRPVRAAGHRVRRARRGASCACVGDKIAAKRLAEEAGVPVAPWSGGPVETVEEALRHAARIGFPLMIKAAAGGGGRGIRRVDAPGRAAGRVRRARRARGR